MVYMGGKFISFKKWKTLCDIQVKNHSTQNNIFFWQLQIYPTHRRLVPDTTTGSMVHRKEFPTIINISRLSNSIPVILTKSSKD
jgi:hypothetical protein